MRQYGRLLQQQAPVVPGAPAIVAPGPPALPPPGHLVGAVQYQPRVEEPPMEGEAYLKPVERMFMIQKGRPSNRDQKLITRQVHLAVKSPHALPEFLRWSHASIVFSREDHRPQVPRPGHSALVLDAQIGGFAMSRIFMDGGSGINIMFADTLRGMNILTTNLAPSINTFHGIIPGRPVYPLASQQTSGRRK